MRILIVRHGDPNYEIEGTASMRCSGIGDVSHLYVGDEEVSFSGRFCECFTDDTRH